MKIKILYEFRTDGDFSLRTPEKFGLTLQDYEYYAGDIMFENVNLSNVKIEAKTFLSKLLCDGLHVLHTHYWLISDFYQLITKLIAFIDDNNEGYTVERLCGNYDGSKIGVVFVKEE